MPRLYEAGLHGRKNGRGFYLYPKAKKKGKKAINPKIYDLLGGTARRSFDRAEIQDRLSLLMVNEAVHCLREGVISSPRDGDLGAILGLGFPPFRGGPFRHVDTVGRETVRARLEELAGKHGKRFDPAALLTEAGMFYQ
jgi:3-hydroxyacyl-CoA dehydrogenase/enoyl-CoA hydratase/3-hydroxybutyryl-CoA epimerase